MTSDEKVDVFEYCLSTILTRDYAFQKKFFNWFSGHLDEEAKPSKKDPSITTIVPAIKRILSKYLNWQEEVATDDLVSSNYQQKYVP